MNWRGRRRRPEAPGAEVLIEYRVIGNAVKVSALDPSTGTEVSISGPLDAGREMLARTAARKLHYVMSKRRGDEVGTAARRGRRGVIV